MKCPNCGKEMAKDSLYCEHCGEDIHIVPDFEPEVELNIEQTISSIMVELGGEIAAETGSKSKAKTPQMKKKRKKLRKGVCVLLTFLLLLSIIVGVSLMAEYHSHSKEYQVKRASQYVEAEEYDAAIACYLRAIELDANDLEPVFELARVYFLTGNLIEYENLLYDVLNGGAASSEQIDFVYEELISLYDERGDYPAIEQLLAASANSVILNRYWDYIAEEPEFDLQGGYYSSIQPLKLSASGKGSIYYTTDGSEPTEESARYSTPLILENGDHIIKAYFVNSKGISSNVVTKEYHIESKEIYAPEVAPMGGDYMFPTDIEVLGDFENVYYTVDGSNPTTSSKQYTGPIHMPLGKSTYKFAKIIDGVTGTITERTYKLKMNTDFTHEDAVKAVVDYALRTGKIFDPEGFFDDTWDAYCYEYQYVTNINQIDDFYVVAEIYRTAQGALTKTGVEFAVNAYTGKLFRLHQDNGRFSLIELEINTDFYEEE